MNRRTIHHCLTASLVAAVSASTYGGILFEENFRNYNQQARTINDAASYYIDNEPIWSQAANLQIRVPAKSPAALVFANLPALPKDNRFDFHFRYTHLNATPAKDNTPAAPVAFDLVLSTADGKKTQKIRIASDSVAGTAIDWRNNWQWQMFAIKANGKTADIFYTHDRSFRKIATISLDATYDSINLLASPDNHFAISDVVLSTPAALPSFPVEKHFASFESLTQPIQGAKKVTGANPEIVSFNTDKDFGLRLALGSTNKVSSVTVNWDGPGTNGKGALSEKGTIAVESQQVHLYMPVGANDRGKKITLQDSSISFGRLFNQSVRPSLGMFSTSYSMVPQGVDIIREWDRLPAASSHPLDVDFVRTKSGALQVYADGSLVKTLSRDGASVTNITFEFGPGTSYTVKQPSTIPVDKDRFTTFDFSAYPRAKAFAKATSSLKPGMTSFSGIPINVAAPIDSADVAICKEGQGNWALECDEYHGRFPTHGYPSAIHYRIPAAFYGKAHLLFALDPNPEKDRILTIRLGHYNSHGSGGNMLGDTILDFSNGQIPANCREVGTLKHNGKSIPIYLADVTLNLGPILDVATGKDYDYVSNGNFMDFEFVGKGYENFEQIDNTMKPDPHSDSAFNIFGVTLEKLPVQIFFDQNNHPGNIYTSDEKNRKTFFDLVATRPNAKGKVSWTILDVNGKELSKGERPYSISKVGDTSRVEIALGDKLPPGYYTAKVVFDDAASKCEFTHDATFAILPPEKRKVDKLNSPYAVWWFAAHGSPGATEIGGPILQKAGIVRFSANSMTPENYVKYNTTNYRIHYTKGIDFDKTTGEMKPYKVKNLDNPDDPNGKKIDKEFPGEEGLYIDMKRAIEADPIIDTVMMWHESGPGYGIPEELLGYPMPDNLQEQIQRDRHLALKVDATARVVHRIAKELKRDIRFQPGNSSAAIGSILRPVRAGAKIESYDQIGIETPSQVIPPERLSEVGLQGMVITREVGEYYAKKQNSKKIPALNGCWEFTYRTDRDMGEKQQAEWYMRDVLISLANNFYYISPGILFDCKNAYYNGLWGGSGLIRRGPFCYPKQAYVAYGVLTSVLDGVKFIRQIDTGSTTVYALEFKRVDGLYATALWTARGEAMLSIDGAKGATATHMLGNTETVGKDSLIQASTSPTYLVTKSPVKSVTIDSRSFSKDEAIAARASVASPLDDAAKVTIAPDPEMETKHNNFLPILRPSDYTVSTVTDDAKGSCIEVTLDTTKNPYKSHYITEYTTVRLAEPALIPGNPAVIGVWVKGNSNWGQIRFEIEDANGEVFKNLSTGLSWGCDIMDWPGNLSVNFDGWNYVYTSLRPSDLMNDHSPGPLSDQWVSEGGNKKIDFPVKVRAITIGMNRSKLDLLDFKDSAPSIRLCDVGGAE